MTDELQSLPRGLGELIQGVLELQVHFTPLASPAMSRRRELINAIAAEFAALLAASDDHVSQVKGSNGAGNNAKVPWVRVFDPAQSPRPTLGWYVVLLFAADGSAAYLSLNQGVTKLDAAGIEANVSDGWGRVSESPAARTPLMDEATRNVDLRDPGLGAQYARGNLLAFRYNREGIPSDGDIKRHLRWLSELLTILPTTDALPSQHRPAAEPGVLDVAAFHDVGQAELSTIANAIHWSEDEILNTVESLRDASPQIVLAGPPGTGKTFVARHLAAFLLGQAGYVDNNPQIEVVQFHPTYGYEEFVEGLRPTIGPAGAFEFAPVAGTIVQLADAIAEDGQPRVLIIDEMNRANLPRVFGELYYLLEYREQEVRLMYRNRFALPEQLFIIGTMNTADRSIRSVDFALRRRFDFFDVKPSSEILKAHYSEDGHVNELGPSLYSGFDALNEAVFALMGDRHHGIGHSYFMLDRMSGATLRAVWERQVQPLLEDYVGGNVASLEGLSVESLFGE
ncbi:McrB family protein [Microbacterium sp. NPDC058389]|uniref:McrB family protein n=1 Tax=Microbacterium sp. NPDC058389 TaxID=3346475 RepID=UPI0036641731